MEVEPSRPDGFQDNNGRVTALVPLDDDYYVAAKWIRQRPDGRVELLAGLEDGEEPRIVDLYATPDLSDAARELADNLDPDLVCNRLRRAPPLIQLRRTLLRCSFPLRSLFCLAPRAELYLSLIQCGVLSVPFHHAPIRAFPLWLDVQYVSLSPSVL